AQLNFKLLEGLDIYFSPTLSLISDWYGLTPQATSFSYLLSSEKPTIILHPKSKGSAREWHLDNYYALALQNTDKQFFITGTTQEGLLIQTEKPELLELPNVENLTGKFSLEELIHFIGNCDGLIACSTGPLHIAAALGIYALGIYPPIKPMHPTRWQPIGKKSEVLVLKKECSDCRNDTFCACINAISVAEVSRVIGRWKKE
ncbi:MAG: glycosyltransferase family 9 protein, partial [Thermonemataceae bacterium]|nr:glycosyltransferase family 9 protein [Thermonemataceae bacterium]